LEIKMSNATPRFALPFIAPGQAQKELYHNEALSLIDALLQLEVQGTSDVPPAQPQEGDCWLIGPSASGAWAGKTDLVAISTTGGWRYVSPMRGMRARDLSTGLEISFHDEGWGASPMAVASLMIDGRQVVGSRQPAVPSPSGGTIIDAEARVAITKITAALMSHGLIE
jgi:hypothetical protein